MATVTRQELASDEQTRFAMSIINAAYASDGLDRLGVQVPGKTRFYLPSSIQYLAGSERDGRRAVFGCVHTADFRVVETPDDPAYAENPYAGEIDFIRTLQPGDVAVIDTPADDEFDADDANERKNGGVWGGLLTALSMSYGAVGAVINGPIRDIDQINGYFREAPFDARSRRSLEAALGVHASEDAIRRVREALLKRGSFPVFGTGAMPTDSAFRTEAFRVGEPIEVGGVTIRDRDFIVADIDGQVVIPNEVVRDLLELVIEIDEGDKGVWADALTRLAGFHDDSIDTIIERHGGHL